MKQVTDKDVAIIILNWNAYDDTFECLKSLEHLTYPYFHVFLVDNDSQDDSFKKLQQNYKEGKFNLDITFIQIGANLGFAGGNNVAIKEAYEQGYQYFWMLNNDTVVDPNALTPLVEALEADRQIGIVGSKIYYYGTNRVWFAGGEVNKWTGKTRHIGYKQMDTGQYNNSKEVDYITGCSLFFSRRLLEDIGYMTEDYFLYYEETEWNIRAKQKGWSIVYVPESVVYHKVSAASGGENNISPHAYYYFIRNCFVMICRTQKSLLKRLFAVLYLLANVMKKQMKVILGREKEKKVKIMYIYRGAIDALRNKMGKID
ncbi:glycosyltransferase family 2 protein [Anoxybacillus flavithermus]|uniref:Glycosyl transferase family 2 n=1 Tax=Anoxybacillus flavithermus TaxID=33934 RepID=A0A178T5F0_9BACL|nr:glycosyltransferase family 2 protein [Anoxybacillus flavithermus]OAO76716.1 glycosyl transferase family 2 [Anoxybacillus flavithermus]